METLLVLILWVLFGGTHIVLCANPVRRPLERRIGEAFKGLYALISLATIVALFWYYLTHKHAGVQLWGPTLPTRILAAALMLLALLVLGAGFASPPPSSFASQGPAKVHGMMRITRHPVSSAFFLFGLAHCLVLGRGSDLAFFGGWCVFTLLATWHQDARKSAQVSGYARLRRETSFLPFLAMLRGKQRLSPTLEELRWIGVVIGLVLFVLLSIFHSTFFGGAVY